LASGSMSPLFIQRTYFRRFKTKYKIIARTSQYFMCLRKFSRPVVFVAPAKKCLVKIFFSTKFNLFYTDQKQSRYSVKLFCANTECGDGRVDFFLNILKYIREHIPMGAKTPLSSVKIVTNVIETMLNR
jgi:hypothetical protein